MEVSVFRSEQVRFVSRVDGLTEPTLGGDLFIRRDAVLWSHLAVVNVQRLFESPVVRLWFFVVVLVDPLAEVVGGL